MTAEANKELIRRYVQAIDDNESSDCSVLDEFTAEGFVAHNPPIPGVSLDREGMKQAAEIFRQANPRAARGHAAGRRRGPRREPDRRSQRARRRAARDPRD